MGQNGRFFEAIPNGMFFRWRFAPSHPCIAEVGQNRTHFLTSGTLDEGSEAEHRLENVVLAVEKASF